MPFFNKSAVKVIASGLCTLALAGTAQAQQAKSLDELLSQLEQGKIAQSKQNQQREAEFLAKRAEQDAMLKQVNNERIEQVTLSTTLERNYQENEVKLANQAEALNKRMGELKELFGVLQQVAGDTKSKFQNSVISAQIPGREAFLDDLAQSMGSTSKLASIEDIEKLWFELQREMTESAKVAKFQRQVVKADGESVNTEVIRVGNFNLISNGSYLEYINATGSVAELQRQPSSRYLATASALESANNEQVAFALDPTGGSILSLLVQAPNNQERIEQGGTVGYIILAIGAIGLLIALERFVSLFLIGRKVNRQLKNDQATNDNPLGRVMLVKEQNPSADVDTLELKLSESILREQPKLSSKLTMIKIISVVAPLIGLLGTVTGMINTFQAITLFGTGDPKLMAGGISQALVTTVLGLVVAIPMVFLFTMLNTRSRNIISILQQQSAGIIAERSEKGA
ncbi:MotA/TolQ/ExbB proton channel family protein [Thalassotalea mangrovi]|uniref:Energy transducer TonB n=1 Tax=Thalassotalea mangrovi TaxID=2572245 RepID=A0A4U1B508_9GAMM|nr:MotA/TolQ/ExbB proton channel family protein [Thalassotalea mangrovi]TKB44560.1 energy transducer TonB [Thalassotalea mangrovi]